METLYKMPVWETITTSWQKVSGSKSSVWGALLLTFAIMLGFAALHALIGIIFKSLVPFLGPILGLVGNMIGVLFELGLLYIGIQRAFDLPISYTKVFRAFEGKIWLNLIVFYIIEFCFMLPAMALMVIPVFIFSATVDIVAPYSIILNIMSTLFGIAVVFAIIYILVRIWLAPGFILDKKSRPIAAIKLSLKATRGNFWNLVGIGFFSALFFLLGSLPLGIGLIWVMPLNIITYGMMYKRLLANVPTSEFDS